MLIPLQGFKSVDDTLKTIQRQGIFEYEIIVLRNGISRNKKCPKIRERYVFNPVLKRSIKEILIKQKGKGNALNVGMKKAKYENICILDADCMLKDRAIETALNHFKDPKVVAVGGRIQVINETHSWIEIMQQCEYMATFQIARSIFAKLNAQCLISGAFGIFRKSALLEIGGYDTNTVGEDMELVLRLQDGGKVRPQNKLVYEKNAVCYTCVPQDIFRLLHQRDRWQRGLLDSLIKHRHMIADLNYGFLGLALLYQLLFELLGPVIVLVFVSVPFLRALIPEPLPLFIAYVTGKTLVTLFAAYLEEEKNFTNVIKRAPVLVLGTILIIALQIVLIFVRLYGMITFPKRKLVW